MVYARGNVCVIDGCFCWEQNMGTIIGLPATFSEISSHRLLLFLSASYTIPGCSSLLRVYKV